MTTTVVLIRHAKPDPSSSDDDFSRTLSEEGKVIQKKMNLYLKARKVTPDAIWHSPLKRAEETAFILSQDFNVQMQEELALGEFFDEDELVQKLTDMGQNLCIFMVGHGPQLMRLATYLAGTQCYPISPPPSSVLVLEFTDSIKPSKAQFVSFFTQDDLTGFA